MSYYNFNNLFPAGMAQDRVRGVRLPAEGPQLSTVEEAFTSENWIIRIYKVKSKCRGLWEGSQEEEEYEEEGGSCSQSWINQTLRSKNFLVVSYFFDVVSLWDTLPIFKIM